MSQTARQELRETAIAVLPVSIAAGTLLVWLVRPSAIDLGNFVLGSLLTIVGLALFMEGARVALLPAGEQLGSRATNTGSLALVLALGLLVGAAVTLAEPDVRILSQQLEEQGALTASRPAYVVAVASGVGASMMLALVRAILDIPIIPLLLVCYTAVATLALMAPAEALAHAFDFGAVTTGPVSVPILLALNTGVVSLLGGHGHLTRSFGLLGIVSVGPVAAVLALAVATS